MEPTERPGFPFPGLWFQAGQDQIHLILESPEAGPAGLPEFQGTQPSRGFHFAFEVDDCDRTAETLRDNGITIVSGPRSRPDGPRQLYIYDPDGHLVELFSR
jgi:catechol 2,3-dioxygenase-like lactoylglutathione lyase family enzyme